jgi:hypothetical protein
MWFYLIFEMTVARRVAACGVIRRKQHKLLLASALVSTFCRSCGSQPKPLLCMRMVRNVQVTVDVYHI